MRTKNKTTVPYDFAWSHPQAVHLGVAMDHGRSSMTIGSPSLLTEWPLALSTCRMRVPMCSKAKCAVKPRRLFTPCLESRGVTSDMVVVVYDLTFSSHMTLGQFQLPPLLLRASGDRISQVRRVGCIEGAEPGGSPTVPLSYVRTRFLWGNFGRRWSSCAGRVFSNVWSICV